MIIDPTIAHYEQILETYRDEYRQATRSRWVVLLRQARAMKLAIAEYLKRHPDLSARGV